MLKLLSNMKSTLALSIVFVVALAFTGCNKCEPKNELNGMVKKDAIVRVITPQGVAGPQFINGNNEFYADIEVSFDEGVTYGPVDFSKYSVFALPTTASCSSGYNRNVSANDAGQTVTYTVTITECDYCEGTATIPNWVLTTKVPASYTPIFEVN